MTGASSDATQAGRPKPSAAIEPNGACGSSGPSTSTTSTSGEASKRGGWASRTKRIQRTLGSKPRAGSLRSAAGGAGTVGRQQDEAGSSPARAPSRSPRSRKPSAAASAASAPSSRFSVRAPARSRTTVACSGPKSALWIPWARATADGTAPKSSPTEAPLGPLQRRRVVLGAALGDGVIPAAGYVRHSAPAADGAL